MLHFSDALIIHSPFFPLILLEVLAKGGIAVTLCKGAKHPSITVADLGGVRGCKMHPPFGG